MTIINFTLIVQAINFFIAFFILKYFFIKYAVAHVHAEHTLQESLVSIVQEHQLAVTQKEKEIQAQWQTIHAYFVDHAPTLKSPIKVTQKQPPIVKPHLHDQMLEPLIHDMTQEIVKKVGA